MSYSIARARSLLEGYTIQIDTSPGTAPWAGNCRVEGYPFLVGGLQAETLPTMECAIITYDPFNRPRANGWSKKSWRFIALEPDDLKFEAWS